jgi:hypothetical protein
MLAGAEDVGWKSKRLFVHKIRNYYACSLWSKLFAGIHGDCELKHIWIAI